MNKDRRKEIQAIVDKLDDLQNLWDEIKDAIESVRDDEQDYCDNMPESLKQSDRGYAGILVPLSLLEDSVSLLDDLDIETLRGNLETAAG